MPVTPNKKINKLLQTPEQIMKKRLVLIYEAWNHSDDISDLKDKLWENQWDTIIDYVMGLDIVQLEKILETYDLSDYEL